MTDLESLRKDNEEMKAAILRIEEIIEEDEGWFFSSNFAKIIKIIDELREKVA